MAKKNKSDSPANSASQHQREPARASTPPRRLNLLVHLVTFALLVAATCLLYAKILDIGYFDVDDTDYVVNNTMIKTASTENITKIITTPYFANYSPMHLLSYMLDAAVGGDDPRVYHWSSNIWAGMVAGFVYLVAWAFLGNWLLAFLCGLLFVLHPSHVEAVAWISSRKDLVAAAFALPSMLAWLRYREHGPRSRAWYVTSFVLFIFAVAGKLSVIVLPAMWFLMDLIVDRRRDWGLLLDKLPFAAVVVFFVLRTMGAQPPTGYQTDLFIVGHTFAKCIWLLTGFGEPLVFRPRPGVPALWFAALCAAVPVLLVLLPLLLKRFLSAKGITLYYWIMLALIPAQGLSFVYPVSDRYLFFPSVAFSLLLVWLVLIASQRWGARARTPCLAVLMILCVVWGRETWKYLDEWRDPRSVWHAASARTTDVNIEMYLGNRYQDAADQIAALSATSSIPQNVRELANLMLQGDPMLAALTTEWRSEKPHGAETRQFQKKLLEEASKQFDVATRIKGSRVTPNLFFRRGKLQSDLQNWEQARIEFQKAAQEGARHTSADVRNEMAVRCPYAIGVVFWHEGRLDEALEIIRRAEEMQKKVRGTWIPDIAIQRERLETSIGFRSGKKSE